MFYAGLTKKDLEKPQIGIAVWFDGNPCNSKIKYLSSRTKSIDNRGLLGMRFNTVVSDEMSRNRRYEIFITLKRTYYRFCESIMNTTL